ncbi:hypothetical protein ACX27_26085 [Nostoc piscinale CENA21]|uniref:Uncharacterized protein n=1 Tax=Nostoc piscinale CENA21 TaxID=224013 RepID=A0A0M5MHW1_9NOSO|nr:hypothetical protein [Nostoc piscinale]ALF55518.1 hypothetical protein ACX27_26085 [Nostoc piscinale CENA21]
MIISDLEILEIVEVANVQGGVVSGFNPLNYTQTDTINTIFNSTNNFVTEVTDPFTNNNSAAAGAKGNAINPFVLPNGVSLVPTYSYSKADTVAVTSLGGGSFSQSSSGAVINLVSRG